MWVLSLGWEDPLEEEMPTHSSTLAWKKNLMARGAWWTTVHGVTERHNWAYTHTHKEYSQYFITINGI